MFGIFSKLFGTKHDRDIRALRPLVDRINGIEEEYQSLSDQALKDKTPEFKKRLADGETLDDIMCEAFAAVKNTCRRLVGTTGHVCGHDILWEMIPFDVQLIGGIALHQGKITEMATGEGKTLVATMPLYLNALTGKSVQLVTTNDYLARRDAQWMGRVFEYLGLTIGCIQDQMDPAERRQEYSRDITYGTNSQFGFDYLRDNGMAYDRESQVQRDHYYAIIDEVDSILIDEARTPLIISGPAPSSSHQYFELRPKVDGLVRKQRALCNDMVREIKELLDKDENERAQLRMYQVHNGMPKHKQWMHLLEDPSVRKLHEQIDGAMLTDMRKEQARELREDLFFTIDERGHDANLTEKGCETLNPGDPNAYVLPDLVTETAALEADASLSEKDKAKKRQKIQKVFTERSEMIHNVDQLIRAYCVYEKDVQYVIQSNQIMIVDEFTGRIMPGRRWSDGLHQAIEAKEGVKIERETQTLATITIQNYFRMYDKLAGMTGTAETEANEFHDIYKLDVIVIPTNRPIRRVDGNDLIYKTQREKFKAVINAVRESRDRGQPVLLGTATVDTSELLSRMLKRAKIQHNVLNAKNHESEAEIVTRAGRPGAVTIATNMAGRGTDIKLGEGVVHIERDVIESQCALDDKVDGDTLRRILLERPCGLHVIGSERHESRRIDRQLRGRCARQGDPGASCFFISLEDDLMRLFGSDRIAGIMGRLGLEEGQELEHRWLNRSIETAQRRVEQQNFAIRKRTLEYDDVMNKQREIVYGLRGDVVRSDNVREYIYDILSDVVVKRVESISADSSDDGIRTFLEWIHISFPVAVQFDDIKSRMGDLQKLSDNMFERVKRSYDLKVEMEDGESVEEMERHIILSSIDSQWQDYLRGMDALRQGVNLRAYGQRDPLIEYKKEAFQMFGELMSGIYEDIASAIFRSSTSTESFESFLSALPQTLVHDEVSVLGRGAGQDGSLLQEPRSVVRESG
ncbi:MAG: preprotein translocase subunit SecA, partial [Kiritimatiellae bacterium]|nr:preprotein translocase subunit SecA [Kiritimatiellia bacterium]